MRYLWEHRESPQKMFIIDRNFRSETLSARHAQEFNQCEGIIMDKGLNLRDLLGYLTEICKRVGIEKVKWKPALQRDKPVKVWVSIPVIFKLKEAH